MEASTDCRKQKENLSKGRVLYHNQKNIPGGEGKKGGKVGKTVLQKRRKRGTG